MSPRERRGCVLKWKRLGPEADRCPYCVSCDVVIPFGQLALTGLEMDGPSPRYANLDICMECLLTALREAPDGVHALEAFPRDNSLLSHIACSEERCVWADLADSWGLSNAAQLRVECDLSRPDPCPHTMVIENFSRSAGSSRVVGRRSCATCGEDLPVPEPELPDEQSIAEARDIVYAIVRNFETGADERVRLKDVLRLLGDERDPNALSDDDPAK